MHSKEIKNMNMKVVEQGKKNARQIWNAWKPLLEDSSTGPAITDVRDQEWLSLVLEQTVNDNRSSFILENTDKTLKGTEFRRQFLTESESYGNPWSSAADSGYQGRDTIGGYAKRLPLMFRRGVTDLVAPSFMGTQAMDGPQAFVYTIKGRYRGNGDQKISIGEGFIYILSSSVDAEANWTPDTTNPITAFDATAQGHVTQAVSNATGIIRHRDGTKVLVEHVPSANAFDGTNALTVGNGSSATQTARTPVALFDNEAGYKRFFPSWTHGDYLPDYVDFANANNNTAGFSQASTEIREMGLTIDQSRVQAQTRKIKSTWPVEVEEDLSRNAQINFMTEIMNEMYREMNLNMNREMVRLINTDATSVPSFDIDTGSDGRWYVEKIMGLTAQIDAQAEAIRIDTRRGIGNRLLVSPLVRVALSQLPVWSQNNITGTTLMGAQSYAGSLGGKYDVHVDIFAEQDYVNIAYRGSNTDAGYFWCPYIGLTFAQAKNPQHLFDTIAGLRTRYGLLKNPFGPELYYRYMPVTGLSQLGISF
jgi:hypothetical protein